MSRLTLVALSLAAPALACASFDMMLVADNTAKAIHRFDPMNRTYLGSFGQSSLTTGAITATAIDQASNRMYVAQGTFVSEFDYNTGEQTRLFVLGSSVTSMCVRAPGELFFSALSITPFLRYDMNANAVTSFANPTSGNVVSSVTTDGTNVYALGTMNGLLTKWSGATTGTLVSSVTVSGISTDTAAPMEYLPGDMILLPSRTDRNIYNYTSGLIARSALNMGLFNSLQGATRGHGLFRYAYGTLTAGGLGYQRSFVNGNGGTSFAAQTFPSQIQDVQSIVTVVAPEPGSLMAMALGAIILLRRRNR